MRIYTDQNGDFITVREACVAGTYAFWRIKRNKPKSRGNRIKTKPAVFFNSREEGFHALHEYAEKRGFQPYGDHLPTK